MVNIIILLSYFYLKQKILLLHYVVYYLCIMLSKPMDSPVNELLVFFSQQICEFSNDYDFLIRSPPPPSPLQCLERGIP